VYHPLCGVSCWFVFGGFAVVFSLSKRVLLMRLSFAAFSRHVFNNSNCLALGWLLLDFFIDVFTY
jgi:hypothetical protein